VKFFLFFLFFVFTFAKDIYVAACANVTYVMPDIIASFNKSYPNVKVNLIISSSGKLTAQLLHGAKYDVFVSADTKYPNFLYQKHIAITPPKVYAKGKLVLFSLRNISDNALLKADKIAIANPKTAPYGEAAVEYLKNSAIYNQVKNKLIYAPSVAGAFLYTLKGADIGIIAKSLVYSDKIKNLRFYYKDLSTDKYSPINQSACLISDSKEAREFFDFLYSPKAKKIFAKYGYVVND